MKHYRYTKAEKNAILLEKIVNEKIRNTVSARNGNIVINGSEYDAADTMFQIDPIKYMDMIYDEAENRGIPWSEIDWDHFPRDEGWHAPFGWG